MVGLALPLAVGVGGTLALLAVHRRARPWVATLALTVAAVAVAVATVALGTLFAIALTVDPERAAVCRWLLGHEQAHEPTLGAILTAVLALLGVRVWAAWRGRRRTLAATLPDEQVTVATTGVDVLDDDAPVAFAHPGRGGRIVVSRGLLRRLTGEQRLVVVAHERSHLRLHHHWYLSAVDLAVAAVPFLGPLARAVRFHAERWADEDVVRLVGGDRRLVAETIARVALAGHPAPLPGAGGDVAGRVEALLTPVSPRRFGSTAAAGAAVVAGLGALTQLHHLVEFVLHVG